MRWSIRCSVYSTVRLLFLSFIFFFSFVCLFPSVRVCVCACLLSTPKLARNFYTSRKDKIKQMLSFSFHSLSYSFWVGSNNMVIFTNGNRCVESHVLRALSITHTYTMTHSLTHSALSFIPYFATSHYVFVCSYLELQYYFTSWNIRFYFALFYAPSKWKQNISAVILCGWLSVQQMTLP